VVDRLRCPHCGGGLALGAGVLLCENGHSHDVARQGYVTLTGSRRSPLAGDSAAMVEARRRFLSAGHYAPLSNALADAARDAECILDLGAGPGHHLARVLDGFPDAVGLALDSSRPALRRALRAHPRIAAVACDVWQELPLGDRAIDLALNVFAPRNAPELGRVLASGARLLVVTPTERHLAELVAALGMLSVPADKQADVESKLAAYFEPVGRDELDFPLTLTRADLRALVQMGPSAHHVDPDELEQRLAELPEPAHATASVVLETFRRLD
jgi:23S rRNA (guanine745-N1)-methyltransferase